MSGRYLSLIVINIIRQLKVSKFITEWKTLSMRSIQLLQKLPHIIPHNKVMNINEGMNFNEGMNINE